jgi:DNA helicase-2/ATP-dependent DNA helicase PcrA
VSAEIRTGPTAPVPVGELRPADDAPPGDLAYGLFPTVADEDAWLARSIARRWQAAMDGPESAPPTTAVLLRRRSDMPATAEALRAAGLPVEVVGLGGLLDEPEIADLVATLRVLVDPTAGAAAIRLLTGARWQLGIADLEALAQRARALVRQAHRPDAPLESGRDAVRAAVAQALSGEDIDSWCLIDAVSDPGPPENYSPLGYRRLVRFAAHLRRLRGRMGQPLTDLLADIERATGLDIEVQLGSAAGRVHLDAFADVVAEVAATGAGPRELLDYLDAAAEREDGLSPGEVLAATGRVQVLTVHAAKGLEWEIVAVPHLTDGVFPITRGSTWLGDAAQLPPEVRGDRDDLPQLSLPTDGTQKDLADALTAHATAFGQLRLMEERRLLYVALTRAERVLLFSGHHWGASTTKPAGPSEFFRDCAALAGQFTAPDEWAPPPDQTQANPLTAEPRTSGWPLDPLGDRRLDVRAGADRVLAAITELAGGAEPAVQPGSAVQIGESAGPRESAESGDPAKSSAKSGEPAASIRSAIPGADPQTHRDLLAPAAVVATDPFGWADDVTTLLAERAAVDHRSVDVELPGTLSVSALVELADDPQRLARRLRRPIPLEPAPQMRRGTAFHQWLERFFRGEALLDVRDLPGAGDGWAVDDQEFDELRERFLASAWANRVPVDIEVPFATRIAGLGLRGRVDAVFADQDGGLTVVDWKTGPPPPPARRSALGVQLACYRLAIAEMTGVPLAKVRAAFHYVPTGTTIAPADLLDAEGIGRLLAATVTEPASATATGRQPTTASAVD